MNFQAKSLIASAAVASTSLMAANDKPNVILIMTDDMGIECLQTYGGETYNTPNLNKLAEDGVKFGNCYSQSLCTPSRVKIMTGRYNFRNYTKFKVLDTKEVTFGHTAKAAGYKTCVVGKWQLDGKVTDDFAKVYGFDEYSLWYLNHDVFGSRFHNPVVVENGKKLTDTKGKYGPDIFSQYAIDFVRKHKKEKFFLYYPMVLPHFPFVPTPNCPEWKEGNHKANNRFFKPMVEYMDKMVGALVKEIDKLGLAEDTIIMFTSDNGTMRGLKSIRNGKEIPGGKGYLKNIGNHVPFIARWKGKIKPGSTSDALIDFSDFFVSVNELTGAGNPTDRKIDGESFVPILLDPSKEVRKYTFSHYDPKWGTPEIGNFVRNKQYKFYGDGKLFDVINDEKESVEINPEAIPALEMELLNSTMKEMKHQGSNLTIKRKDYPDPNKATEKKSKKKNKKK